MIRVAVLTVSDGVFVGTRQDESGPAVVEWVERRGWKLIEHRVVPDETTDLASVLCGWADGGHVDLILTVGGTGFGARDVTPEATHSVVERQVPGIPELLRARGLEATPFAILSRAAAGIRGRTLIVNLPGSERAVRQGLDVLEELVPHAVELLGGRTEHRPD